MVAEQVDVVVVGAGLAGLVTARQLTRSGRTVRVVEARDRVGGRTYDRVLDDGTRVELGGQWIGPTQDRIAALAAELGLPTFPTYNQGENLLDLAGRQKRYKGTIPMINPVVMADVGQAQARIERLASRVPLDAPWDDPRADVLDSQTVEHVGAGVVPGRVSGTRLASRSMRAWAWPTSAITTGLIMGMVPL